VSGKPGAPPGQRQAGLSGHARSRLLLQRRAARRERRHDGKVAVAKSNQRWCSDGFEFRCDNGELLRVTFALDCCDREAMSWAATTGGHSGDVVRDVMLAAVENRLAPR
jgi:putative transposase